MWNRSDWQQLYPWLAPLYQQPWRLGSGLLLMLLTALAGIGLLGVSGWFITSAAVALVAFDIYTPGGAIRFFALLRTLSRYLERLRNHDLVLRMQSQWRVQLFSGLARRQPLSTRRYRAAHILQRLTQDVEALDSLHLRILAPTLVAGFSLVILCLLVALWLPWTALILFVLLLSGSLCLLTLLSQQLSSVANRELGESERLRTLALEHIEGQAEMLAWQVQATHEHSLIACAERMATEHEQVQKQQGLAQAWLEGGSQLCMLLLAFSALIAFQQEALTAPVAVLLPLALLALPEVLLALPQAGAVWGRVVGAAGRLNTQVLSIQRETQARRVTEILVETPVALTFEKVSVHYQQRRIWQNLSLHFAAGSIQVVSGPSGVGKSSLAHLAAGLAVAQEGRVLVDGRPVEDYANWYQQVAYLTQESALLSSSIEHNLRLGNADASTEELWQVLQAVELDVLVKSLPEGLQSWTGDGGCRLSGGQARRLALARALLKSAPLLILDEPFRAIDADSEKRISRNILPWLQKRTVFMIAHQTDLLPVEYQRLQLG
ncbi:thiol reductant ABC exporter subunit CydC [Aliidiomarina minuta]|uniref:Thiol reductant ABC exporter subunit CydC n=1 Tax=Aliidiomarina minuta TaxID=880057 RepID=A0A432W3W1_9GAMM|nr:thiol reductant ABC exporter subunit CydC [Aliidiomarina minuta]RUO24054.1 thiol reductant ABC exporter subunit CydC [Aliidiomarina minuta]